MAQLPEMYPVKETTEAINILREINACFASNPVVRDEFFALITDLGKGVTADVRGVLSRANKILQGHPRLAALFQDYLAPDHHQIEPPNNDVSKPRPRRRKGNIQPASGAELSNPRADPNGRNGVDARKRVDEEINNGSLDEANKAKQFLERVKNNDKKMYDGLLAELLYVDGEQGLDAHQVYRRFKRFFGSAHGDLLRGVAQFLPSEYNPPRCAKAEREEQRPTPKRKHASYYAAGVDHAESSRASRIKRPPADDGPTPNSISFVSYAHAGAAGRSRPSRAKVPHAVDGEKRRATLGAAANGTGRGAGARDDDVFEVQRFRRAWEFETGYSKLVATMTRAVELQRERAHGASGSDGRRGASLEELFPSRECREYLAEMYHDAWEDMREMLEDGGQIGFALEFILDRLRMMEAEAVEEARSRRDPIRAAQKLDELVQDRVREERERRGA